MVFSQYRLADKCAAKTTVGSLVQHVEYEVLSEGNEKELVKERQQTGHNSI